MNISGASARPYGVIGMMALGLGLAGCDEARTQAGPSAPPKPSVDA